MPFLDVSDILLDPDFADFDLLCTRNVETVNDQGRAVLTPRNIPFAGVVTNDKGDTLNRSAEGTRVSGTIVIHTPFLLREDGTDIDADIVTWNGKRYVVSALLDYSTFGGGFVAATCTIQPISG